MSGPDLEWYTQVLLISSQCKHLVVWQKKASNDGNVSREEDADEDVESVRLLLRDFQSSLFAPITRKSTRTNFYSAKFWAVEVVTLLHAAFISCNTKCSSSKHLSIVSRVPDSKFLKLLACLGKLLH